MAAGAPRDFVPFIETCTDSLLVTAYLLTRDRLRAEELVQDTLVALYPKWHKVARAEATLAYVRRAMVNRYLNQRRRPARGEVVAAEVPEAGSGDDFDAAVAERDRLRRAMARLSDRQRAALVLRFYHDLADAEAARVLGCRIGTVRSLVSRALAVLRDDATLSAAGGEPAGRTA